MRGTLNLKLVNIRNSQNQKSQILENEVILFELHGYEQTWQNLASQVLVGVFVVTLLFSRD